jgi:chromosome segregation ATPase
MSVEELGKMDKSVVKKQVEELSQRITMGKRIIENLQAKSLSLKETLDKADTTIKHLQKVLVSVSMNGVGVIFFFLFFC